MSVKDARIAIIGAGPTGIEAALAAHEHGYRFTLYEESSEVAAYMSAWGHVRLFSPWDLDVSPRARKMLAALGREAPTGNGCPTGDELAEAVFRPLAASAALAPHLEVGVRVLAISRDRMLKSDAIGDPHRADEPFRLLLRSADGSEKLASAEIVLDCTGNYGHPNPLGAGGIAAPGEARLDTEIVRQLPNFSEDRASWAGKTTLLVGSGYSAQTAVVELARIAEQDSSTRVLWALRQPNSNLEIIADDPLPSRAELTRRAAELAESGDSAVERVAGVVIDALERSNGRIAASLRHRDDKITRVEVDRVLSLTGYHGDYEMYRQLQVHECWATSGPMKLAAALLSSSSDDCLEQGGQGAETLVNPEPNFFILGSKSYGRNSSFLMRAGWEQVDDVFCLLD
ncbi:MAG: FAD-dependent oxidoreductase [Acidobacteriota bacterium]